MPVKDATEQDRGGDGAAVDALLGPTDGMTPRLVTLESLNKLTLKQLLDGAKKMGLTAVSKLKKDALVKAVLEAWHVTGGQGAATGDSAPGSSDGAEDVTDVRALKDTHGGAAGNDGAQAEGPAGAETDGVAVPPQSHKFEVGQPGRIGTAAALEKLNESSKAIPWGYGRDRVTAMAVDSDQLFAYWEVLDDSMTAARAKLGPGGPGAWLNLRVYDTTGRIFDGTNAHGFFDHKVERGDRQWFFTIGRPTSEAIIEIGLKSHEGYFVKIARSGRVEFPRREPAPPSEPEWLTVHVSTGHIEHANARVPGRPVRPIGSAAGASPGHGGGVGLGFDAGPGMGAFRATPWKDAIHFAGLGVSDRQEWEEVHLDGEAKVEEFRSFRWDGPSTITSWEAGPFPYPVEIPEPVREVFSGKTRVMKLGGRTHIVYGPWQVVIRGMGAQHTRVVLSRWEVYRTWAEETGHHVEEFASAARGGAGAAALGGASGGMMGASDRRWAGGSELRLGGASELFFLKASEIRLGGSSERLYSGASEWVMRGASERLQVGASELLRAGASERGYLGASEGRLQGAVPAQLLGAGAGSSGANNSANGTYPAPPIGRGGRGGGNDDSSSSSGGA